MAMRIRKHPSRPKRTREKGNIDIDKYVEIAPIAALQPYVHHFAIQESENTAQVKVVPRLGMVMGFQFAGRICWRQDSGPINLSTAGITGLLHAFRVFEYTQSVGSILIYFRPLAAAAFLPLPANELQEKSASLYEILPAAPVRETEEKICSAHDNRRRIQVVEDFLLKLLRARNPDAVAMAACHSIVGSGGNIRIGQLSKELFISRRQLERRFSAMAGTSPKQFASLVRFQKTLEEAPRRSNLTSLGFEAGYADQSHFIREFERFTGQSPRKYFAG